jgi:heme-degrading monooxygenase HmoA
MRCATRYIAKQQRSDWGAIGRSKPGVSVEEEDAMFAVVFEVQPKSEQWGTYLELAKKLKPEIENIDGFIDNERFQSQRTKERVLSLSTWRDEKAVIRWRTQQMHHDVQVMGRQDVFADYRLRVGEVTADSDPPPGLTVHEQRFDETDVGAAKVLTITEVTPLSGEGPAREDFATDVGLPPPGTRGLVEAEAYVSIYTPGKILLLAGWTESVAAGSWVPHADVGGRVRQRHVRVIRDYGIRDRREAPQYYPPVR